MVGGPAGGVPAEGGCRARVPGVALRRPRGRAGRVTEQRRDPEQGDDARQDPTPHPVRRHPLTCI